MCSSMILSRSRIKITGFWPGIFTLTLDISKKLGLSTINNRTMEQKYAYYFASNYAGCYSGHYAGH